MAPDLKIMALCAPAPVSTASAIPDELVREKVERLAVFSHVMLGLWTIGLVIDLFIVPFALGRPRMPVDVAISISGIVASAAMALFIRFGRKSPAKKAKAGLLF